MTEMLALFQTVFALSLCRRRASTADVTAGSIAEDVSAELHEKPASCPQVSYDDDCQSTGASGPEQMVDSSSDGSDTDSTDLVPNSEPSSGESDSDLEPLSTPKFRDFTVPRGKLARRRTAARLKRQAGVFRPSAMGLQRQQPVEPSSVPPVRQPIKAVINALDDWKSSKIDGDVQSQRFDALGETLSKLAPRDAMMMKALLDARLAYQ